MSSLVLDRFDISTFGVGLSDRTDSGACKVSSPIKYGLLCLVGLLGASHDLIVWIVIDMPPCRAKIVSQN